MKNKNVRAIDVLRFRLYSMYVCVSASRTNIIYCFYVYTCECVCVRTQSLTLIKT